MLCWHCQNIGVDPVCAPEGAAGRLNDGNGAVRMVMVCECCAASLGPDLAAALRRKADQLQQFGLAEANGFILEPMIGPPRANDPARPGAVPNERYLGTNDQ